jgi:hypothetical protein
MIEEADNTMINQLKWDAEFICHKRLKGGNPKGFN